MDDDGCEAVLSIGLIEVGIVQSRTSSSRRLDAITCLSRLAFYSPLGCRSPRSSLSHRQVQALPPHPLLHTLYNHTINLCTATAISLNSQDTIHLPAHLDPPPHRRRHLGLDQAPCVDDRHRASSSHSNAAERQRTSSGHPRQTHSTITTSLLLFHHPLTRWDQREEETTALSLSTPTVVTGTSSSL